MIIVGRLANVLFLWMCILGFSEGARLAKECMFDLQQSTVVGYGDLMAFPGLWNGEGAVP